MRSATCCRGSTSPSARPSGRRSATTSAAGPASATPPSCFPGCWMRPPRSRSRRSLGGSRRRCGWFTGGSGSPATPTTTTGSQPHRHELAICWSGRRSLRPKDGAMRIESSVSSVSWLPLGAVQALPELAFASGVDHYDPPPPDRLQDPEVLLAAPTVWTTLALTIHADGRSDFQLTGASPFPRHWIYDHTGRLAAKSGLIDFQTWYRQSFGQHTPWRGEQSPALVTAVESALERQLSAMIIGSHPRFVRLQPGEDLVEQGAHGSRLFVLFDGVLLVLRDGRPVAEVGPGAVLGEMALLDGGQRTATLRAVTPCRVAVVPGDRVERGMLEAVASHRHDQTTT